MIQLPGTIYSQSPIIIIIILICSNKKFTTTTVIVFRNISNIHKQSYNKNLAIANISRVSCAHNTLRASIGINMTP